jgi:protein-S-isoprenylcysteine O-methyltransferase Ste14
MKKLHAALGSFVFLLLAPGVVAGVVPWLLTGWSTNDWSLPVRLLGVALIAPGLALLLHAFGRFVIEGRGTPAPVAPTEHLVVGGAYRYVRNPMYLAVLAAIVGQALLLGRVILLAYAAAVWLMFAAFVRFYEEPTLARRYGEHYAGTGTPSQVGCLTCTDGRVSSRGRKCVDVVRRRTVPARLGPRGRGVPT